MTLKIGEELEGAWWFDGRESEAGISIWRGDMVTAFAEISKTEHVLLSPIEFTEFQPGDHRTPQVPDHIQGPNVRMLVASCRVLAFAPRFTGAGPLFTEQLDKVDLARLRLITRRVHQKARRGSIPMSDFECDKIINAIGPETAFKTLRESVDNDTLH